MAKRGYGAIFICLDKFLVIGAIFAECMKIFTCLIEFLQELGFEISWHKVVPSSQHLIFLGILIDTIS